MSLPRRMAKRREEDAERERVLRITKNDPMQDRYGGIRYTALDIEALEEEMVPWLKRKRRAS